MFESKFERRKWEFWWVRLCKIGRDVNPLFHRFLKIIDSCEINLIITLHVCPVKYIADVSRDTNTTNVTRIKKSPLNKSSLSTTIINT